MLLVAVFNFEDTRKALKTSVSDHFCSKITSWRQHEPIRIQAQLLGLMRPGVSVWRQGTAQVEGLGQKITDGLDMSTRQKDVGKNTEVVLASYLEATPPARATPEAVLGPNCRRCVLHNRWCTWPVRECSLPGSSEMSFKNLKLFQPKRFGFSRDVITMLLK